MSSATWWRRITARRKDRAGMTLVETTLALAALAVAMGGLISAVLVCTKLRTLNESKAIVRNVAEDTFSAMRGMGGILNAYNRFGGGTNQETFSINRLQDPSANQPAGRIIIWRLKNSLTNTVAPPQPDPASALVLTQAELLEAQTSFASTFPNEMNQMAETAGTAWNDYLDTNGDGLVDVADEPQLMPVTIRIRWRSASGMVTHYFSGVIGRR